MNPKPLPYPHGSSQIYDWPGGYVQPTDGDNYASARVEELQQPQEITTGQSTARGLTPGYLFSLERCQRRDQNRQYLVIAVNAFVRDNPYHTGVNAPALY